jgi:hypothetical protein
VFASRRIDRSKIATKNAQAIARADHLHDWISPQRHGCGWLQAQFRL